MPPNNIRHLADRRQRDIPDAVANLRVYGKERAAPKAAACAIYARISDDRQESLPVQLEHCRHYAARLGLPIACEYQDEESGLITTRRQYREMMALARAGRVSHVILFHSSRFGREDGEYVTAARELERLGVELHTTTLGRIDPGMVGMHALISNLEVRNISAHVLPNMIARAERGLEMGGAHFGYRRTLTPGVREPDPATFPIIQALFGRYAAGESLWGLTAWFNSTSGMHKRCSGVKALLADPYYVGLYVYNRWRKSKIDGHYLKPRSEWIWARHAHPAVDQGTWDAVQARLAGNRNIGQERASGPRYALTGLVWCAACRKRMAGRPDGRGRYPVYHCPYCIHSKSVRKVEGALRPLIEQIPLGPAAAARMRAAGKREGVRTARQRTAEIDGALRKLAERRARLTALYADGELTQTDYRAALAVTDTEQAGLVAQQRDIAAQDPQDPALGAAATWLESVPGWGTLLDDQDAPTLNALYRRLLVSCTVDFAALTLSVAWLPPIAALLETSAQGTRLS